MDGNTAELELFVEQINHLKRSVCAERYRYTLEYLDLAMTAARREAPSAMFGNGVDSDGGLSDECDIATRGVADPLIVH